MIYVAQWPPLLTQQHSIKKKRFHLRKTYSSLLKGNIKISEHFVTLVLNFFFCKMFFFFWKISFAFSSGSVQTWLFSRMTNWLDCRKNHGDRKILWVRRSKCNAWRSLLHIAVHFTTVAGCLRQQGSACTVPVLTFGVRNFVEIGNVWLIFACDFFP